MAYVAAFDIGTTNMKGILLSDDGLTVARESNVPLEVSERDGRIEQRPDDWLAAFRDIVGGWLASGVAAGDIRAVSFSGQLQDLIPLDAWLRPVGPAMLYSDGRASFEAADIMERAGADRVAAVTANPFNGTQPLAKLLWLKRHEPERYAEVAHVVISPKDFLIARLTGAVVTDPASASTAGAMDVAALAWSGELLAVADVPEALFPRIAMPGDVAGRVHDDGARLSGLAVGTPVLCGLGDAGAATLGAGVYSRDRSYLYLGTTGWAATASKACGYSPFGAFNLGYYRPGLYIQVAPILNAGNAHHWAASTFGVALEDGPDFAAFEAMVERGLSDRQPQLAFLPYLNGERCPVQDMKASGSFVGIKPSTTREHLGAAVLEGVAMSLRQVTEALSGDRRPREVTVIGGGAKSRVWCQLLADVMNVPLKVPSRPEYLPAVAAGMLGAADGDVERLPALMDRFLAEKPHERYEPVPERRAYYEEKYALYLRLYPALAPLWQ